MLHAVRIAGLSGVMLLGMFLPFLPGRHDSFAVTLSSLIQLFSFAALPAIPIGLAWLALQLSGKKLPSRFWIFVTLLAGGIIALMLLVGTMARSLSLGVVFLAVSVWGLISAGRYMRGLPGNLKFNPIPLYLAVIPLVVFLARFMFIGQAAEFSRNYAIRKSAALIEDIESYYATHAHYPVSLQALHHDYSPEVIGISQYFYEPNGAAYNVYFRQLSDDFAAEEVVMYNKNDEHSFAAHARDILEFTGRELALRRGDSWRHETGIPHWIYIKFD